MNRFIKPSLSVKRRGGSLLNFARNCCTGKIESFNINCVVVGCGRRDFSIYSSCLQQKKEETNDNLENKLPASEPKEKATPTFTTQVYNLKNGIEAMEQQVLAYFPKTSIQMSPLFLNEMMKNPKNYYWFALAAILTTSGLLYMYYVYYYKQFVGKLMDQERNDQQSAILTLRSIQLAATNYGSFPSLITLNLDKLVEKLNSEELNIEIRRETLSTIYLLCHYDYFVERLMWKRDFLSSLTKTLSENLTEEVTKAILGKLFSSKNGLKILREECPTNFHNAISVLVANNRHDIATKLLYHYYEGSIDKIKSYYEEELHLDSTGAVSQAQLLKNNNTSTNKLKLSETTEDNTLLGNLAVRLALIPIQIGATFVYCVQSWKKRANSPPQFNKHIGKWAIVAGVIPAIADILVTVLNSEHYSRKIEKFYSQKGDNSSTQFSPLTVNAIYSSIRMLEVISMILVWRRARFILVPTLVNVLVSLNIDQYLTKKGSLQFFDENLNSNKENLSHRIKILHEKESDDEYEE